MLKRTKQAIDLWTLRAFYRAKYAALTGATFGGVLRAMISRKAPPEMTLARLLTAFIQTLRAGQASALVELLDNQQKLAFMEIMNTAAEIAEPQDVEPQTWNQTGPRVAEN